MSERPERPEDDASIEASPGEDATPDTDDDAGGKRKGEAKKRHTVARVVGISVLALAMITGLTMVWMFRHLSGNLDVVDVAGDLDNRPAKQAVEGPKEPLNILVMGEDLNRAGVDQETGGGSDTTILLHLSADRKRAYGISIPRDSMVDRPACDHGAIPAQDYAQWNAAYSIGGAACTIQQFEQLTGVRIDHYLVVDFAGFQDMVDAVGGVEVCLPEEVNDQEHGIHLEAGTRTIEGREALAYVRQRYVLGNKSDLARIQRQQAFIASMAHKVLSADTLANPIKLAKFLDAATKSLTVDPGLKNVAKIAQLGVQFRGIGLDEVQFITVPWEWDPQNPYNRVVWSPEAEDLWAAIAADEKLEDEFTVDAISAADPTTTGGKDHGKKKDRDAEDRAEVNEAAGLCG